MPESFIPVWMSLGEAEEFRRFLQEEARSTEGEFPERELELINSALREERPRSFEQLEAERKLPVEGGRRWKIWRIDRGEGAEVWSGADGPFTNPVAALGLTGEDWIDAATVEVVEVASAAEQSGPKSDTSLVDAGRALLASQPDTPAEDGER